MEESSINRLIIIGNGYDLKLQLKTSYKHFLYGFVNHIIENIELYKSEPNILFKIIATRKAPLKDQDSLNIAKKFLDIKTPLLEKAFNDIDNLNWTDLERIYYSELIKIYDKSLQSNPKGTYNYLSDVSRLNLELDEIKKFLAKYLNDEVANNRPRLQNHYYEDFSNMFDNKDFDDATLKLKGTAIRGKKPSKVFILNFNYTNLFSDYFNMSMSQDNDITIVNIHGTMDDPSSMVFGYGDELDENYSKLESLDEDEWLRHFKSFSYFRTKDYDKLLGFIETGDFQTWIVGHSCGLSDKTLLNHIFEHEHCINLKAYYHENDVDGIKKDNFDEICYSISRIMKDKKKMRQIVTKKHRMCNINFLN